MICLIGEYRAEYIYRGVRNRVLEKEKIMTTKITKHIIYTVLVKEEGDRTFRTLTGYPSFRSEDSAQQLAESLRVANPNNEYFVQKYTQYSGLNSKF